MEAKLAKVNEDIGVLDTFYNENNSQWGDLARRNTVDYAHYTKEIGTFEVEAVKFRAQFKGNVVDLGALCLTFLIITPSNKNNLQESSLLTTNSPACSSSSPPIASSGSTVGLRTSSWLFQQQWRALPHRREGR